MQKLKKNKQSKGAMTLMTGLLLTLMSSLVMYYVSRDSITELRASVNEARGKVAFEAAQAGINHGVGYFAKHGLKVTEPEANQPAWSYTPTETAGVMDHFVFGAAAFATLPDNRGFYSIRYCPIGVVLPACPDQPAQVPACGAAFGKDQMRQPVVVSCGWSENGANASVRRIVQMAAGTPSLPGKITSPLVTQEGTNVAQGNASIWNFFNDLTVWSGADMKLGNATNKTFIKDKSVDYTMPDDWRTATKFNGNNVPAGWTTSTSGESLGHDVIVRDPSLKNLTDAQFFAKFMGQDLASYVDSTATWKIDLGSSAATSAAGNGLSTFDSTDLASLANHKEGEVIYVRGDMDISSLGTTENPVILIVDGNLTLKGSNTFNGLIFVTGKTQGAGGTDIFGALISKDSDLNGNPNIIFDPDALANASLLGRGTLVPGGWTDW